MMSYKPIKIFLVFLGLLIQSVASASDDLRQIYLKKAGSYPLRTHHLLEDGKPKYVNELIRQTSPYLLQHAHNPVNWMPWGEAAFELARKQDKPVFLSVGYSTCHWCHVMERESFENKQIAEYINKHFIAVKVDREEHPDVDEVYLTAVQMLSGKAGWPLTAVLTPNAAPFFGGTYLPPEQLSALLEKISTTWEHRREAVLDQASRTNRALEQRNRKTKATQQINAEVLKSASATIAYNLFSPAKHQAPGFPREPEMLFLLDQLYRDMDAETIQKLVKRLRKIVNGGIHDHVGGGFHRYSVDAEWQIPHFEKMLYNQAQMGEVYSRAYQLSGEPWLLNTANRTFNFVLDNMQSPEGGFYSAIDAESGGIEGGYYIWTLQELKSLLTPSEIDLLRNHFGISEHGNFNDSNVLILQSGADVDSANIQLLIKRLAMERKKRTAPATDTKVISAWNGLTISSLIRGYQLTQSPRWRDAAQKAANLIWEESWDEKLGLARTLPNRTNRIEGALEDYAFYARALLDIYDLTADQKWLTRSKKLADQMLHSFYDEQNGGFYISRNDIKNQLMVPLISARDDAITSGNSVATQLLSRLYRRTGEVRYRTVARSVISRFSTRLVKNPQSLSGMLIAASELNIGETGAVQYAAKGNVIITSYQNESSLEIDISVKPGWHINAHEVLQTYLISTQLSTQAVGCAELSETIYPEGKLVTLGFQKEQLKVYEGTVNISSTLAFKDKVKCKVAATVLKIQGCTDQVCASPETLTLRTGLQ